MNQQDCLVCLIRPTWVCGQCNIGFCYEEGALIWLRTSPEERRLKIKCPRCGAQSSWQKVGSSYDVDESLDPELTVQLGRWKPPVYRIATKGES